jgi:hypothetical protein
MTLIETAIALAILLTVASSVMSIGVVAIGTTENQGHLAARTAEYAQDKMEELIGLLYCNGDNQAPCNSGAPPSGTNTTVFPATCCTGYGLALGGSADPTAPVNGYVDYLDVNGNLLGGGAVAPANWYYIRVWRVSTPAGAVNAQCGTAVGPTIKQITVTSRVRFGVGTRGFGALPQSTLTTLKSCPF